MSSRSPGKQFKSELVDGMTITAQLRLLNIVSVRVVIWSIVVISVPSLSFPFLFYHMLLINTVCCAR